eukprot:gene17437-biopygen6800
MDPSMGIPRSSRNQPGGRLRPEYVEHRATMGTAGASHPGDSMGPSWGEHGAILGTAWGHPGRSMGPSWGQHGAILRVSMGPTWGQHGAIHGEAAECLRSFSSFETGRQKCFLKPVSKKQIHIRDDQSAMVGEEEHIHWSREAAFGAEKGVAARIQIRASAENLRRLRTNLSPGPRPCRRPSQFSIKTWRQFLRLVAVPPPVALAAEPQRGAAARLGEGLDSSPPDL